MQTDEHGRREAEAGISSVAPAAPEAAGAEQGRAGRRGQEQARRGQAELEGALEIGIVRMVLGIADIGGP